MKYRKSKKRRFILNFIFIIMFFLIILIFMDYRFVPKLQEISHMYCKSMANQMIDESAESVLSKMNLQQAPLLSTNSNENGYIIHTQTINLFCTRFSEEITERMIHIPEEQIHIPLGAITNFSFLANKGPEIPFSLLPVGTANVDYASDFDAVGINQVNYKIWLEISLEMKIVNPIYQEKLMMDRKIMLVDVVFSGKVPDHFFQIKSTDEYLLTE